MYIYTLEHPITNEVRYVGFTSKTLEKRFKEHLRDKRKCKRNSWMVALKKEGLIPIIKLLDFCTTENWKNLEQYWIEQFRVWGFKLTNMTEGGDGTLGYKQSEKQKLNNSLINKGKTLSKETRLKISKSSKGKKGKKYDFKERPKHCKQVHQYDKNNQYIKSFKSTTIASNELNILITSIINNLTNRSKTAGGFKWKRIKD
jgi:group I intron endonuclease